MPPWILSAIYPGNPSKIPSTIDPGNILLVHSVIYPGIASEIPTGVFQGFSQENIFRKISTWVPLKNCSWNFFRYSSRDFQQEFVLQVYQEIFHLPYEILLDIVLELTLRIPSCNTSEISPYFFSRVDHSGICMDYSNFVFHKLFL